MILAQRLIQSISQSATFTAVQSVLGLNPGFLINGDGCPQGAFFGQNSE